MLRNIPASVEPPFECVYPMPHTVTNLSDNSSPATVQAASGLVWRVHLLRRDPTRLPVLLLLLFIAAACVWLMFVSLLPVLAAVGLLLGAASEYLFPISYCLNGEGITANGPASRLVLRWKEARRCQEGRGTLLLTALPTPSRLDAFRGVLVRFAPDGEPGDRESVLAAVATYAPTLISASTPKLLEENTVSQREENGC